MKTKKMKLSNISCLLLSLAFFTLSCSKMNDLHQSYLDEGEMVYGAKVDSVVAGAGKNRIEFEIFVRSQRIETVRIFWNDFTDSTEIQVNSQPGIYKKLLEDMEETEYIFQFISIDKYGHRSLPFEVTGNVYGDRFQAALINRAIKSTTPLADGNLTIHWSTAVNYGIYCNLVYMNVNGNQVTKKVPMSESTTLLTDLASGLKYNTSFIPEPAAIDTFYTDFKSQKIFIKVDRSDWTVTADSYEPTGQLPNGAPEKTIDGDASTYWHTEHSGGMPDYPHWLAYDMKKMTNVSVIELTSRSDQLQNDFTDFIVQQSVDGIHWIDCEAFKLADITGVQTFNLQNPITTRYIRVYMVAGPNPYTHLAEFSVGFYD